MDCRSTFAVLLTLFVVVACTKLDVADPERMEGVPWTDHCVTPGNCGTFQDSRETPARSYKWVKIGTQVWMAENLDWLPSVVGKPDHHIIEARYYVYGYNGTDIAIAKEEDHFSNYGVLYNYAAALTACPNGWHLPEDNEWILLETTMGGDDKKAQRLKSTTGWDPDPNIVLPPAEDTYGFSALPGGQFEVYDFVGARYQGFWWTATPFGDSFANYISMGSGFPSVYHQNIERHFGFSVRCVQDPVSP